MPVQLSPHRIGISRDYRVPHIIATFQRWKTAKRLRHGKDHGEHGNKLFCVLRVSFRGRAEAAVLKGRDTASRVVSANRRQMSRKSLSAAFTLSTSASGSNPNSLRKSELSQAWIWSTSTSLSDSRLQVPRGMRTRKGNASSRVNFVVRGRMTVLSRPASLNSEGWIARQGSCFPRFVPSRG
jgi:hypothetical protein